MFKHTISIVILFLVIFSGVIIFETKDFSSNDRAVRAEEKLPEELFFTILHTNDIHGRVDRFPILAGAVNEIRKDKDALGEPVLLTDGGDFISPVMYSWLNLLGCAPELKMMQKVGYDVITLGNHEFDAGSRGLAQLIRNAGYPDADLRPVIVATNTVPPENHPLAEAGLFGKTHLKELSNGLKVGYFGLHGRGTIGFDLFKKGPVKFPDPYLTAQETVNELREAGVDIIILLIHDSFSNNIKLAAEVPGIDIILGGHNHRTFEPHVENDTIIIQTSSYLEHLAMLELAYNTANGYLRLRNEGTSTPKDLGVDSTEDNNGLSPYHIPLDDSINEDPSIREVVTYFDAKLSNWVYEVTGGKYETIEDTVAYVDFQLGSISMEEMPFGNFATDAIRIIASEKLGERVDFSLLSSGLCWGDLGPGEISFRDLGDIPLTGTGPDLLPGHPLVTFFLTGHEVRRIMEIFFLLPEYIGMSEYPQISGARLNYDPNRTILFTLPFSLSDFFGEKTPLPSLRAVVKAERYTGEGPQSLNDEDYVPLKAGDETLYRVVTESYVLFHLPTLAEVAQKLPMLQIIPKDRDGNPIQFMNEEGDISANVVLYDNQGNEVKAWQALLEYTAMQPPGGNGIPEIPSYYAEPMGRINYVKAIPFYIWFVLIIAIVFMIIFVTVRGIKQKRRKKATADK